MSWSQALRLDWGFISPRFWLDLVLETLAARRFSKVQEAAEEIRADGYMAEALELDVTNNIAVKKAFLLIPVMS